MGTAIALTMLSGKSRGHVYLPLLPTSSTSAHFHCAYDNNDDDVSIPPVVVAAARESRCAMFVVVSRHCYNSIQ